jgi:hypothetical protein
MGGIMPDKLPESKNVLEAADPASVEVNRRDLFHIGNVLALPVLLGGSQAMAAGPLRPGPEIYQSIGVEPVINCRGTFTIIGASVELPEVRAAIGCGIEVLRPTR